MMKNIYTLLLVLAGICLAAQTRAFHFNFADDATKLPAATHQPQTARDYWNSLTADPNTGKVSRLEAIQQADQLAALKAANLNLVWEEAGPGGIGGRTRAILIDPSNPSNIFAGNAKGGIWYSNNAGQQWHKVNNNDALESMSVATIARAANGDLYFGTGESFYLNSGTGVGGFPGEGIWKSTNGGTSFNHLPSTSPTDPNSTLDPWAHVNKIATDPINANLLYAATGAGLKISADGGMTWTPASGTPIASCTDVVTASDGTLFAVIDTKVYTGGAAGTNMTNLSSLVVHDTLGPRSGSRMVLAIAPSNPDVLYCLSAGGNNNGLEYLFQSKNKGINWTKLASKYDHPDLIGYAGKYAMSIAVDPVDEDHILIAGEHDLYAYTPSTGFVKKGGSSFSRNDPQYLFRHIHEIKFNPSNPVEVYIGNDGGIYKTADISAVTPLFEVLDDGYYTTATYGVAAAANGDLLAGSEFDGSLHLDHSAQKTYRMHDQSGTLVEVSRIDTSCFFAGRPNGKLLRSTNGGLNFVTFTDAHIANAPGLSPMEGTNYVMPFKLWENISTNQSRLFALTNTYLWLCEDAALTTSQPSWFRLGMLPVGITSAFDIAQNGDIAYLGTTSGRIYRVKGILGVNYQYNIWDGFNAADSGVTFDLIGNLQAYITSITIDPNDPGHIVITLGQYGRTQYLYESTNADINGTVTFNSIQGNLPYMPIYDAVISRKNPAHIILGTDLGIWATDDGGATWTEENNGMARVPVSQLRELEYQTSGCYYLYAATYGRGLFISESLENVGCQNPLPPVWDEVEDLFTNVANCYPTGSAYLDVNNVSALLQNGGDLWWDVISTAGYEVPKGTGHTAVFSGAIWLGGIDDMGQLKVAAQTYRQTGSDFYPGPVEDPPTTQICNAYDRIWKVRRSEIEAHYLDLMDNGQINDPIPQDILEWPGKGNPNFPVPINQKMAPFVDADGDSLYDATKGDFPKICGDMALWWVFNDVNGPHTETGGAPLGIDVKVMAYAFDSINVFDNTTFYQYTFTNHSNFNLDSMYIGNWVDIDLGCFDDDYVGCDTMRDMGIGYNGDAVDDGCPHAYGAPPPMVGYDLLRGPDQGNGQFARMSSFRYYGNDGTVTGNPRSYQEFYYYLTNRWLDGTPVSCGGDGYMDQDTCYFMFPDDPTSNDPQAWSECHTGNIPADRRFLMNTGPFPLPKQASTSMHTAMIWVKPPQTNACATGFAALGAASDSVQQFFDQNDCGSQCYVPYANFNYTKDVTKINFFESSFFESSYHWDFGDGGTSTQPNPFHIYSQLGTYHVCLTVSNACGVDVQCFLVHVNGSTGIDPLSLDQGISIYPNPFTGQCWIETTTRIEEAVRVEVMDIHGTIIYVQNYPQGMQRQWVDLAASPAGVYYMRLSSSKGVVVRRMVLMQ